MFGVAFRPRAFVGVESVHIPLGGWISLHWDNAVPSSETGKGTKSVELADFLT